MSKNERHRRKLRYAGFTLIELSLVLVIIGLIVGGVLVGRDLIKAAEFRAQVSQIQQYQQAVTTFYSKYQALPGDVASSEATKFGLTARSGVFGDGNGDRNLQGCSRQNSANTNGAGPIFGAYGCETASFWADLSQTKLTDFSFSFTNSGSVMNVVNTALPLYFPTAKIGNGSFITVYSDNQYNYFVTGAWVDVGINSGNAGSYSLNNTFTNNGSMTPKQMNAIDSKMDDGLPEEGRMIMSYAFGSTGFCWAIDRTAVTGICNIGYFGPSSCINSSTSPHTYNISGSSGNMNYCTAMLVRFQ